MALAGSHAQLVVLSLPPAALNMTSASSFQMLRGSVIIFTGLLSVAFLGRKLELSQWLGILVTIVGLVVVGLADMHSSRDQKHKLSEVITGTCWPVGKVGWSWRGDDPPQGACPALPRCPSGGQGDGRSASASFSPLFPPSPPFPSPLLLPLLFLLLLPLPAGDLLIIMAQVIVSIQMVLEEKFVYKHNVHPLRAVGTEGLSPEGGT